MKYHSVVATRLGSPDVLEIVENDLRGPEAGEARIKVLAASMGALVLVSSALRVVEFVVVG